MSKRCPRCGRGYEGALKRYCSRCHVELVEAPPEPAAEPVREAPPPAEPRELPLRARFEGALFAVLLLCAGAVDLLAFVEGASIPLLLLLGVNGAAAGAGAALYLRERRRSGD